ncbi:MAG: hypothetical protein JOY97_02555 [Hyphomicrobiales bacterium]|nr:hypothetical protein [Hyphomicrobiales bacterium]
MSLYAGDWEKNGLQSLKDYESQLLNLIIRRARDDTNPVNVTFYLSFSATAPDSKYLTALSRLAHEVGHVIWYREKVADNWKCNGKAIYDESWDKVKTGSGFHKILDSSFIYGTPKVTPYLTDIIDGDLAIQAYDTDFWPSIFALAAPDEDFAETFRMLVLSNSGLTSLTAHGSKLNVAAESKGTSTGTVLARKAKCILDNLPNK